MPNPKSIKPYWGPVGGWGSARAISEIFLREGISVAGALTLLHQNKPYGYACVSCSYAKPGHPRPFEFCENGAKATLWEATDHRVDPEFFAEHTCKGLEAWPDHELEKRGRPPRRYRL